MKYSSTAAATSRVQHLYILPFLSISWVPSTGPFTALCCLLPPQGDTMKLGSSCLGQKLILVGLEPDTKESCTTTANVFCSAEKACYTIKLTDI